MSHQFLLDTYDTERLKTLGVWAQFREDDLAFRPAPKARSVLEQLVHQCQSEEAWMAKMLGIASGLAPLPAEETRAGFVRHYAQASSNRLRALAQEPPEWFDAPARFFDATRSRAWILVRRFTHSAHHRGQLTTYLRLIGRPLYSTYGPTADTGGLPAHGGRVLYAFPDLDALLRASASDPELPSLPEPNAQPPTERPEA